jgi:hypothetical protein
MEYLGHLCIAYSCGTPTPSAPKNVIVEFRAYPFQSQGLHTDPLNGDVIPKCDKVYEDASELDYEAFSDATDQIAKVYGNVHIHIIYGELNDSVYVPVISLFSRSVVIIDVHEDLVTCRFLL